MTGNLYVGIDWADDHHDAHFTDDSTRMQNTLRFDNEIDGFNKLHEKITGHQPDPSQVFVMIETPRGLLVHSLLEHGYRVYAINPKSAERYKEQTSTSGAKSDPVDARALADAMRKDRDKHRELHLAPDDYRRLEEHCGNLRKLNDQATRLSNQMTSALKEYYPQAVKLFSDVDSAVNLAFLKRFPSPQSVVSAGEDEFTKFLRSQHYTHPRRSHELFRKASAAKPSADTVVAEANEVLVLMLVDQLAALLPHRKKLEGLIAEIFSRIPESNDLRGLPGLGPLLAPEVAGGLGPAEALQKRFGDAQSFAALSGCAPVTRKSGKSCKVHFRLACDKNLRRTFFDWAFSSIRWCPWAQAFYNHHKARRMAQPTILRNLAQKWIKILFHLLQSGSRYDEAVHIAALKKHGVEWAAGL